MEERSMLVIFVLFVVFALVLGCMMRFLTPSSSFPGHSTLNEPAPVTTPAAPSLE